MWQKWICRLPGYCCALQNHGKLFPKGWTFTPCPKWYCPLKHWGNCSLSGFSHITVDTSYRVEKASVEIKRPFCIKCNKDFCRSLSYISPAEHWRKVTVGSQYPQKPLQPQCQIYKYYFHVLCWTEQQNFIFKVRGNSLGPIVVIITDFSIWLSPV